MSINELEAKARELRQLQALIDEAQAEAEALKDAIKAAMGDQDSIQAGEYRITWKPVTSVRIDTAAKSPAGRSGALYQEDHRPPLLRGVRYAPPGGGGPRPSGPAAVLVPDSGTGPLLLFLDCQGNP